MLTPFIRPTNPNGLFLATHVVGRSGHITTRFCNIPDLVFAQSSNFRVSVIKPLSWSDHKLDTCSSSLRNKLSPPMSTHRTVAFYRSTRWDETPAVLQATDLSRFVSLPDPQNAPDHLHAKPLVTSNRLSRPVTQHKPRKPGKVFLVQIKLFKTQKIFNGTSRF